MRYCILQVTGRYQILVRHMFFGAISGCAVCSWCSPWAHSHWTAWLYMHRLPCPTPWAYFSHRWVPSAGWPEYERFQCPTWWLHIVHHRPSPASWHPKGSGPGYIPLPRPTRRVRLCMIGRGSPVPRVSQCIPASHRCPPLQEYVMNFCHFSSFPSAVRQNTFPVVAGLHLPSLPLLWNVPCANACFPWGM